MQRFRLASRQRRKLQQIAKSTQDAASVRRAIALLELDAGQPATQIAARLGLTRQTLHNWQVRLQVHSLPEALRDRSGRGRPTLWTELGRRFLEWSMRQSPEELGYASEDWTIALLQTHLKQWAGIQVSDTALRQQLHRLRYRWKRPRYVLEPDPELEKKTPNPTADSALAQGLRLAGGGRDRCTAIPAASCRMGPAGAASSGPAERPQRQTRDLWGFECADRASGAALP